MELWSGVLSNNAAKVRIVLAEKNLEYKINELPWTKANQWEPKPKAFLDISPRGQVPVLVDGETAIHDSTVINEYLEERFPEVPLLPTDVESRLVCRQWEDEGDFQQGAVGILISEVFMADSAGELSGAAKEALSQLELFVQRLDVELGEKPYICGSFSVADISVFLTLAFSQVLGLSIQSRKVLAWIERMMSRPGVKTEFDSILVASDAA